MAIPQTIFYLAGYFEQSGDPTQDLFKTLRADGYQPNTSRDVLIILFDNLFPKEIKRDVALDFIMRNSHSTNPLGITIGSFCRYVSKTPKKELGLKDDDKPDYSILPKKKY